MESQLNTPIRQTVDADIPLPAVVDELLDVQTKIAVLEVLEKNLKARLIASRLGEVCGMNARAVVSKTLDRDAPDYQKIVTFLNPPAAVLKRFRKTTKGSTKVTLYGYN